MIRKLIRRNVFLLLAFPFAVVALAQSRTDDFSLSSVQVTEIHLTPREDGGCAARWCGVVDSTDGGVELGACFGDVELVATVNQNRCAGLVTAGVNRVARALRFNVDAGAP